jgi:hypothetical protein
MRSSEHRNSQGLRNQRVATSRDNLSKNPLVGPDVLADLIVLKELAFLCRGNPVVAQYLCHEFSSFPTHRLYYSSRDSHSAAVVGPLAVVSVCSAMNWRIAKKNLPPCGILSRLKAASRALLCSGVISAG